MSVSMYRLIAFFAAGMALGASLPSAAPAVTSDDAAAGRRAEAARGSVRLRGFRDAEMDFQIIRSIGADACGGGALGEILIARDAIADGDPSGWTPAFADLAERVERDGKERLARGHAISARDAFLRAASYYRAAEYYADPKTGAARENGLHCRRTFLEAARLFRGDQLSKVKGIGKKK